MLKKDELSSLEYNDTFEKIADSLKLQTREILGIVDLIYSKKDDTNITQLYRAILDKMKIPTTDLDLYSDFINICLSNNEDVLLSAMKGLDIPDGNLLLVGKGILNPAYISTETFEELGVSDKELINEKN